MGAPSDVRRRPRSKSERLTYLLTYLLTYVHTWADCSIRGNP